MDILTETKHLQNRLDDLRNSQMSIGLVPTMGYLHDGHLSLIRKARSENDAVVTTIFVNPLQFAETEDLDTYPTDIEKDTFLASEAGTDLLFTPTNEEMFCDDVLTTVSVQEISTVLEGVSRPTHFSGVATIVAKLFNIVGVCSAYFGEIDGATEGSGKKSVHLMPNIPIAGLGFRSIGLKPQTAHFSPPFCLRVVKKAEPF